jgi:hypothetical protein
MTATENITDISDAWVRLFDDKGGGDSSLDIKGEENIPDLKQKKFGDKTSSVKFQIPVGWKAVLFDDANYKDSPFELKGTGKVVEISDLGSFSDKASSIRWEQTPD